MTNYEVMFVIEPTLEEAAKETTIEKVKAVIEADGEIAKVDVWGMRKLAYPINKKNEGYYVLVNFESDSAFPAELARLFGIDENIMRHIVIRHEDKKIEA